MNIEKGDNVLIMMRKLKGQDAHFWGVHLTAEGAKVEATTTALKRVKGDLEKVHYRDMGFGNGRVECEDECETTFYWHNEPIRN